jgi:predicted metal-dependent phosphotriesterase family hydrolase
MSHVRTVLGDITPIEMGLTYSHEHIIIEESFPTLTNKEFLLNDVEKISTELKEFYSLGGRTVVDTMPANAGRNVLKLVEVSKASGVHIIAPTGIHLDKYYPPNHWQFHLSEIELSDLFIKDIVEGIDEYDYGCPVVKRTKHKAGLIKLATGDEAFSPHQEKIFRAVVNAQIETGVPILTHTNYGRQALAQAKLFKKLGANLNHAVLSHVDRNEDADYHREILDTGVSLEYDSHFRWKNRNPNPTYELLKVLLPAYPDQLVVGMDMARNTYWKSYGGSPGLNYLLTTFKEEMRKMGLEQYLENIFYKNPQRIFSFTKD